MAKLKIDLRKARFETFNCVFQDLEAVLKELGIDFYVIGALARDMIFSTASVGSRTTADVDLAVLINNTTKQFEDLKDNLIQKSGFVQAAENNFSLISPDGFTVDLLPFGEIEVNDGVIIEGVGLSDIKVNGLSEVYHAGLEEGSGFDDISFKLASLSSLILLKIIAYDDRPEGRGNDPADVASIISNYFHLNDEKIYDSHDDLFDGDSISLEEITSTVVGREIYLITHQNDELLLRILNILGGHIESKEESGFIRGMVGEYCETIEVAITWLKRLVSGIDGSGESPIIY